MRRRQAGRKGGPHAPARCLPASSPRAAHPADPVHIFLRAVGGPPLPPCVAGPVGPPCFAGPPADRLCGCACGAGRGDGGPAPRHSGLRGIAGGRGGLPVPGPSPRRYAGPVATPAPPPRVRHRRLCCCCCSLLPGGLVERRGGSISADSSMPVGAVLCLALQSRTELDSSELGRHIRMAPTGTNSNKVNQTNSILADVSSDSQVTHSHTCSARIPGSLSRASYRLHHQWTPRLEMRQVRRGTLLQPNCLTDRPPLCSGPSERPPGGCIERGRSELPSAEAAHAKATSKARRPRAI